MKRKICNWIWILMLVLAITACGRNEEMAAKQEVLSEPESAQEQENVQEQESRTESEPESMKELDSMPGAECAEESESASAKFAEEESEPTPWALHLIMVGDVLLHDKVEESALDESGQYDFSALFANTKDYIESADLALVNQEVIIGGEELRVSGYPNFNAPFAIGDELAQTGFDVICHATNHALDRNAKGILNCLDFWEEEYPDMEVLGIHEKEEDSFYIYEKDGVRIALLNYTYGTNGIALPSDMPYAVDLLNEEKVLADLEEANAQADFTIVCPHWGTEYRLKPDSMQEKWTQIFLKHGVDLIFGTHPHVIEPIEWVEEEETGNKMLVYYSLGNFVNWTSGTGEGTANRMIGGMADVTLTQDDAGNVVIDEYDILPLVSHVESGYGKVTTYFLSDYSEELGEQNEIKKQDNQFSYQYAKELCSQIWGQQ